MALSQRLEFRQTQALVMTPQLMQAIKLLQLSNLELTSYVEGELERNPLLERAESEGAPLEGEADMAEPAVTASGDGEAGDWANESLETSRSAIEDRLDTGLENVFPDDGAATPPRAGSDAAPAHSEWANVGPGGHDDGDHNLEAYVSAETTLADHLAA